MKYRSWKLSRIKEIVSVEDVSHAQAKRLRVKAVCNQGDGQSLAWRIHKACPDQDLIFLFCYADLDALENNVLHMRARIGDEAHRVANGVWADNSFVEGSVIETVFVDGQ